MGKEVERYEAMQRPTNLRPDLEEKLFQLDKEDHLLGAEEKKQMISGFGAKENRLATERSEDWAVFRARLEARGSIFGLHLVHLLPPINATAKRTG